MRQIAEAHRCIDRLMDNSRYPSDRMTWNKRFHEATLQDHKKAADVDPRGTSRLSQPIISVMTNKGCTTGEAGGQIIKIASKPGIAANNISHAVYSTAKSSLTARTKEISIVQSEKSVRLYNLTLSRFFLDTFSSATVPEPENTTFENPRKGAGYSRELATLVASECGLNFPFAIHKTIGADGGAMKE